MIDNLYMNRGVIGLGFLNYSPLMNTLFDLLHFREVISRNENEL